MNRKRLLTIIAPIVIATVVVLFFTIPLLIPSQPGSASTVLNIVAHASVYQYRNGVLISYTYHAMSLTNGGKDWIADKLFNSGGTNITLYAMYIGCSADTSVFSAAWTDIPNEITNNGLGRALAAWTDTGTGTGNLTKTFNVGGTQSTQLYGLYYDTYANSPSSDLVAAEQQGAGAVKNLLSGDTLTITIQITCS
jgi:hypothetical protein